MQKAVARSKRVSEHHNAVGELSIKGRDSLGSLALHYQPRYQVAHHCTEPYTNERGQSETAPEWYAHHGSYRGGTDLRGYELRRSQAHVRLDEPARYFVGVARILQALVHEVPHWAATLPGGVLSIRRRCLAFHPSPGVAIATAPREGHNDQDEAKAQCGADEYGKETGHATPGAATDLKTASGSSIPAADISSKKMDFAPVGVK